jgi:hypothetical protein
MVTTMPRIDVSLKDAIDISLALEDREAFLGGKGAPAAEEYAQLRKKWDGFWYGYPNPQEAILTDEVPE